MSSYWAPKVVLLGGRTSPKVGNRLPCGTYFGHRLRRNGMVVDWNLQEDVWNEIETLRGADRNVVVNGELLDLD